MRFLEIIFKQILIVYVGAMILYIVYSIFGNKKSLTEIIDADHKESNYDRVKAFYVGLGVFIIFILLLKKYIV